MEATRVPPSAWRTSQSTVTWRSPSFSMSQTARRERPISRCISCVRPFGPLVSLLIRSGDEPGSIEYSAVTHPVPVPRIQRGTSSSIEAVHRTRVFPNSTKIDPSAMVVKSRVKLISLNASTFLPSVRPISLLYLG